jgi:hypothetical protein
MKWLVLNDVTDKAEVTLEKDLTADTITLSCQSVTVQIDGAVLDGDKGQSVRIKVGRKILLATGSELQHLFATMHALNLYTDGKLPGEPAFYKLIKDTGVPF